VAFDPERAMSELVLHTHYLPRHWRGRAHTAEVQQAVSSMFTFKVRNRQRVMVWRIAVVCRVEVDVCV
jgi:hypothetical protein